MLTVLKDNKYNWVSFARESQWKFKDMDEGACNKMIDDFIQTISVKLLHLCEDEKQNLKQSTKAYVPLQREKLCRNNDNEYHMDSESDQKTG